MKKRTLLPLAALTLMSLSSVACASTTEPATFCRYVPERSDDFAWENDKIAFRMYGPTFREGTEDSGIDCWLKRVDYPVINKWYGQMKEKSYHKDWGEGHDPYHVGSSRGCGGLGLWIDGQLLTSNTYTEWKVVKCETAASTFVLTYEWSVGSDSYKEEKQIDIKLGDCLFKATSTFWKNGELAAGLPIAVGLTTHDGKAVASQDISKGWMACWETGEKMELGTGVVMDPKQILDYKLIESEVKDKSHALLITKTNAKGRVEYFAGYGWPKAGEITTSKDWNNYLTGFAK